MALKLTKYRVFGSLLRNKLRRKPLIIKGLTFGCVQHDMT